VNIFKRLFGSKVSEASELRQQLDELMSLINDDCSLTTFEEHVDILSDMAHAYNTNNKIVTENTELGQENAKLKKELEMLELAKELLEKEQHNLHELCEELRAEVEKKPKPDTEMTEKLASLSEELEKLKSEKPIELKPEIDDVCSEHKAILLEACMKIRDKTAPKDRLSSMRRYHEQVQSIAEEAAKAVAE
jgi:chromosome segregation ATPase